MFDIVGQVFLQNASPGTVQLGHAAISGTFRSGQGVFTSQAAGTIPIIGNNTAVGAPTAYGASFSQGTQEGAAVRATATASAGGSQAVLATSYADHGIAVVGLGMGAQTYGGNFYGWKGIVARANGPDGTGGSFLANGSSATAVHARSTGDGSHALFAATLASSATTSALYAVADSTVGSARAGEFEARGDTGVALYANAIRTTGATTSGFFNNESTTGKGVRVKMAATTGITYGVYVGSSSNDARGVYSFIPNDGDQYAVYGGGGSGGSGHAVYAFGRMTCNGTKAFQMDHPLDPQGSYLYHYCSEGPEPYNEYKGNAVLDSRGEAWIKLPAYFSEINRDPSYTLTPIGAPMPGLYVAVEVRDNRFKVAGGKPGAKVSWRVSGVRNDRYVKAYGAQAEVAKPKSKVGTYTRPELYGMPASRGEEALDRDREQDGR